MKSVSSQVLIWLLMALGPGLLLIGLTLTFAGPTDSLRTGSAMHGALGWRTLAKFPAAILFHLMTGCSGGPNFLNIAQEFVGASSGPFFLEMLV